MEKKKQTIYAGISLLALALLVVGATYAYFQNQYGESSQTDVKVTTYTTDLLTFETGDPINITADQETFGKDKGNQTGSSFAKAILQANSKTNVATANYYIYLNIESNEFTYTTTGKPELVLQVTDNSGNPVTSIDGLTYVTTVDGSGTSISGFDITDKSGLIKIVNNKEISASPKTEEQYNVTLVLVNYDFDQNNNAGKSFNAKLMMQKDKINLLSDYVMSQYTGTQGENSIYYHDSTLENGARDNSYRYAGGDYILTDAGKALGVTNIFSTSSTDTSGLIDFYCGTRKSYFGAYCDLSNSYYYLLKNDTTQYSSYNDVINKAVSNGYVIRNKINNFVCFGSDNVNCPEDNLYRIIGVFDGKIKLVKYDYSSTTLLGTDGNFATYDYWSLSFYRGIMSKTQIGTYKFYSDSYGWSTSLLNITNLNINYLNNIGSVWANMISTSIWKIGGGYDFNYSIPSETYQNEIINPQADSLNLIDYSSKIGLMHLSDYGFAANSNSWTKQLSNYGNSSIIEDSWMYMGLDELLITYNSYQDMGLIYCYFISNSGSIANYCNQSWSLPVRPTFYLNSSIKYSSGSGTQSDPIRIEI